MNSKDVSLTKRRVLKGGIYLSFGPVAALLLGFFVSFIVGIYIHPDDLGEYSFINEFISLVTTVALIGLPGAFTKYLSEYIGKKDQQKVDSLLKTQTIINLVICFLTLILALIITPIYFQMLGFQLTQMKLVLIVSTIVLLIFTNMITRIIHGYYDLERLGSFELLAAIFSRIIVIIFILTTLDVYSLLVRLIVTQMILISMVLTSRRKVFTFKGTMHSVRPLILFGLPGTTSLVITLIGQNLLLKGLILVFFGQTEVGYFDYAFRLSTFINTATLGFFASLSAYYARLYGEGGTKKIGLEGGWVIKTSLFLFSPIIIGSIVVSKLLFEEILVLYLPAFGFFVILSLRLLLMIFFRPFTIILDSIGRTKIKLYGVLLSLPIGYLTLLLSSSLGSMSIALTWVIMDMTGMLVIFGFCRYYVGRIIIERRKSLLCVAAAFFMAIPVLIIYILIPGLIALPLMIITGIIVYVILVRELGLLSAHEVRIASSFIFSPRITSIFERLLVKN